MYDLARQRLIYSQTKRKTPFFVLKKLKRWKRYRLEVYATNKMGDSNRAELENVNIPSISSKSKNSSDKGVHIKTITN